MSSVNCIKCSERFVNCGKPPYLDVTFVQFQSPSMQLPFGPIPENVGRFPALYKVAIVAPKKEAFALVEMLNLLQSGCVPPVAQDAG